MNIKKKQLLDWFEALSYAFIAEDLDYKSEEAEEQVRVVYKELAELLKSQGINPIAEMEKRGVISKP